MGKEKRDAGFSLVELIIVVAIMAVLIAILAPQYVKYVEKSRVAKDERQADEIRKSCTVLLSDEEENMENGEYIITLTPNSDITISAIGAGANPTHLNTYLKSVLGADYDKTRLVSKSYSKIEVKFSNTQWPACNITYTNSNGNVTQN